MSGVKHTPGPIWSCKIGVMGSADIPVGGDSPMRRAVDEAFQRVAGKHPEFIFSGWSAELTEPELAVVEGRLPSKEHIASERIRDAAPDLLEAGVELQAARKAHKLAPSAENLSRVRIASDAFNAAIARARGEQSPNHSDQKEVGNG